MRQRAWSGVGLLVASSLTIAAGADPGSRVLYRRATPLEARTGVVSLREVQEVVVDTPAECPDSAPGAFGCRQERRFSCAYVLDFALEHRETRGDTSFVELEDRGRVSLFLDLGRDDREAFDQELRRTLNGLSADSFGEPFAGLRIAALPEIARRSTTPSWTCFEHGASREAGRHERHVEQRPDGSTGIVAAGWTGYGIPAVTDPLCSAAASIAVAGAAEELRTMPVARVLLEETVRVDIVDRLRERVPGDELGALPPGASYTVERQPGVREGSSVDRGGELGESVRASYARDEMRYTAVTTPADLPGHAVAENSWVSRWVLETAERRMGPDPGERVLGREEFRVVLLPTLPPTSGSEPAAVRQSSAPEELAIELDAEALLAEVATRLDHSAALDLDTLERAVAERPLGLGSPGWILAVCRTGGGASYRLAPTAAVSSVRNASSFCAAVDRQLGG